MGPVLVLWKSVFCLIHSQADAKRPQGYDPDHPDSLHEHAAQNHMKIATEAPGTSSPRLTTGTDQETSCQTRRSEFIRNDSGGAVACFA